MTPLVLIAFLLSIIGIYLNAKKIIWCWYIYILSSICWLIYYVRKNDTPSIILWTVFICFNLYGLITWKKEKESKNKTDLEK
jgi:nicotinamide riboside transporter PnuC